MGDKIPLLKTPPGETCPKSNVAAPECGDVALTRTAKDCDEAFGEGDDHPDDVAHHNALRRHHTYKVR